MQNKKNIIQLRKYSQTQDMKQTISTMTKNPDEEENVFKNNKNESMGIYVDI